MKIKTKLFLSLFAIFLLIIASIFILFPFGTIRMFAENNLLKLIIAISSILILLTGFFIILSREISRPLNHINQAIKIIDDDKVEKLKGIDYNRKDEIGILAKSVKALHGRMRQSFNFIFMLTRGKYDPDYIPEDEGMIGTGLIDLRDKLVITEKEKKYIEEENRKTEWYQKGVTEFTTLLQQNFERTQEMSFEAVKKLVKHLEVEQGGIFILEKRGDEEILVLESAYAYDKKKLLNTEIEIGESLVGKCARDKELIHIDDLPDGYTYIGSGMGENTPKSLILVPLIYENNLFGVIEIASLKKIQEYKVVFIEVIGERIASEVSNIQSRILSEKLTSDFKKQAEEFDQKEEEANKTIEKLEKKQQKLKGLNKEQKEIIDAFKKIGPVLIYDREGILKEANKLGKELYDIKDEDIHILNIFDQSIIEEELHVEILAGMPMQYINVIKKEDSELKIFESISPLYDMDGNIEKILKIGYKIEA